METTSFAARLRWWRERRGLSQLALATTAEVSQRHLSFLEVGRTAPSREMVLRLGAALGLPLRQQNALLLAAGFAPAWRESALAAPELAIVNRALDFMLEISVCRANHSNIDAMHAIGSDTLNLALLQGA